jgi:hypothetical protein
MADDTDQAIDQLKSLPPERQVMIIRKLSPDRKAAIMARLQPKQETDKYSPTVTDYAVSATKGIGGAIKDVLYSGPKAITEAVAKPPETTGEKIATFAGPAGLGAYRIGGDILGGLSRGAQAREQAKQEGENWAGQTLRTVEQYPFVGEIVQGIEKGGPHMGSPESIEGAIRGIGDFIGPELALKGAGAIAKKAPAVLRDRAATLVTKNLKSADPGLRNYGKADALEVAQQGIIAGKKALPDKIEARRFQIEQERMQSGQAYNQQGTTVDGRKNVIPIARQVADIANQRGVLSEGTIGQITDLMNQVATKVDMQTGQRVPRNLDKLSVTDAIELTRHDGILSKTADFEGNPTPVRNLARRMRQAIIDEMPPDIVRKGEQESHLIRMREAAKKEYSKVLNDRTNFSMYVAKHSPSAAAMMIALTYGGVPVAEAVGALAAFHSIAKSSLSRTARAAMYARVADLIDGGVPRITGPTGAPPQGGGPMPLNRQIGPQPVAAQGVTPPQGGLPPTMPVGPPALAGQPLPTRPPQLPARATRARAGSGAYAKVQPKAPIELGPSTATPEVGPRASSGTKVGAGFENDALAQARAEKPNATTSEQLARAAEIRLEQQGKTKPKPVSATAKQMAKAKAEVAPGRSKAMMDRLDTLFERRDNPKSGADRVAIDREIEDIKKIVGSELGEAEKKPLIEKLQTRERVQAYRERQRAQAPVSTGATSGEMAGGQSASTAASPEMLMIGIQRARMEIPKLPGGQEFMDNFDKSMKSLKMTPEQEFQGLLEGVQFLKEFGAELGEEVK